MSAEQLNLYEGLIQQTSLKAQLLRRTVNNLYKSIVKICLQSYCECFEEIKIDRDCESRLAPWSEYRNILYLIGKVMGYFKHKLNLRCL